MKRRAGLPVPLGLALYASTLPPHSLAQLSSLSSGLLVLHFPSPAWYPPCARRPAWTHVGVRQPAYQICTQARGSPSTTPATRRPWTERHVANLTPGCSTPTPRPLHPHLAPISQ